MQCLNTVVCDTLNLLKVNHIIFNSQFVSPKFTSFILCFNHLDLDAHIVVLYKYTPLDKWHKHNCHRRVYTHKHAR